MSYCVATALQSLNYVIHTSFEKWMQYITCMCNQMKERERSTVFLTATKTYQIALFTYQPVYYLLLQQI